MKNFDGLLKLIGVGISIGAVLVVIIVFGLNIRPSRLNLGPVEFDIPTATSMAIPAQNVTSVSTLSNPIITTPALHDLSLGDLLFQEDFNGNINQWPTGTDNGGTYYIENGEYHLIGSEKDIASTGWLRQFQQPEKIYDDFYLETQVRFLEGSQENDSYGVLFRYSNGSTYIFVIGNAQQVYSLHTENETLLWWTYSPKIIKDGANKIGILCKGDEITIYINGDEVDSIKSGYRASGGIGLTFASNEHVAFDYVYVWALSE